MGFTPKELVILLVLLLALAVVAILFTGCSTSSQKVSSQNLSTPPLPVGVQHVALSRVQPAFVAPQPALLSLSWAGGASDGSALPACYRVEVSTNLVTWAVLTNIVAPGPDYSVQTLAAGTNYFRVREAQPWEVSP